MTWPNKVYSRSMVPIYTRANDSGMLFRYKGPQRNGRYIDVTTNGNNSATILGTNDDLLGPGMVQNNSYIYSPVTTALVANNSNYSMGILTKSKLYSGAVYGILSGIVGGATILNYGGIMLVTGGTVRIAWYNGAVNRNAAVTINNNLWNHIIYVIDVPSNSGLIYVNGLLGNTLATLDMIAPGAAQNYGLGAVCFGAPNIQGVDGVIADGTMWNRALVAADVRKEWTQYAQMVQFKTGWGAKVSTGNENTVGAYIGQGSSPFEILSGTWKLSTTTIDGELHKVLECVSAGTAWLDRQFMNINSSEAAYGGWRFRIYHATSATPTTIGFTATAKNTPAVTTGYYLRVYDTQTRLGYYNAGAYTDLTSWGTGGGATETLDIQVGRRYDGAFQYSYRRLSQPWTSTGTYTNTTYTTSEGMSINANAGDLISLGTVRDNSALIKYLGEFLPTEV